MAQITSSKDKPVLEHHNYYYIFAKCAADGRKFWRCLQDGCNGRIKTRTTCSWRSGMGPMTTDAIQRRYKCIGSWRHWKRGPIRSPGVWLTSTDRRLRRSWLYNRTLLQRCLPARRCAARSVVIVVSSLWFCRLHGLPSTSQITWIRLHPVSHSFSMLHPATTFSYSAPQLVCVNSASGYPLHWQNVWVLSSATLHLVALAGST